MQGDQVKENYQREDHQGINDKYDRSMIHEMLCFYRH